MNTRRPSSSQTSEQPSGAQPVYGMYSPEHESSVDLIELITALWRKKWLIIAITVLIASMGATYAILATPIYRAEAVFVTRESEQGPALSSGIAGLASIAGIDFSVSTDSIESIATLRSRVLIEEFISDNNLLPTLYADEWDPISEEWISEDTEDWPTIEDGIELFRQRVHDVTEDVTTGLITLSITWTDAELAASWAAELVDRVNERLRRRALDRAQRRLEYLNGQLESASVLELRQGISQLIQNQLETIMLAEGEPEYAFNIIDPARVPNEPVAPRRVLIIIFSLVAGGMLGVFAALIRWGIDQRRRNDDLRVDALL